MLKDLKKTGKHSIIYAIGNTTAKLIGLILIPLYTNSEHLSSSEYGALAVLESTSQLLTGILSMAMIQSLTRWYWDNNYSQHRNKIVFTTLAFLILCLVPTISLIYYFSDDIALLILDSTNYSYLLKLVCISSSIAIINNQILCLAKLQAKSTLYILIQILKLSSTLGLILWGILLQGKGLDAIWEATLFGELIALLALTPFVIKNIELNFQTTILKEMLTYGLPLMIASISGVLLATTDRYMLSSMSSLENTGIYSLGYRVSNTLKVIIATSLSLSLSPLRMKKINDPNHHRFYSKIATYTALIFSLAMIMLSLFSLEFLKFFAKNDLYWEANTIIPILALAIFFGVMKDQVIIGLTISKKTKIIGSSIIITSLINIILNSVLIPRWDIYGASAATLLSQIFFFSIILLSANKAYPIKYEWSKLIKILVLSITIIIAGLTLQHLVLWQRLLIKLCLVLSYPFALYVLNFYERIEIENLKTIFNNWKKPKQLRDNIKRFVQ